VPLAPPVFLLDVRHKSGTGRASGTPILRCDKALVFAGCGDGKDFFQAADAFADFVHAAIEQQFHAFLARGGPQFGQRGVRLDQVGNVGRNPHDLEHADAAFVAGVAAGVATFGTIEDLSRFEPVQFGRVGVALERLLAIGAQPPVLTGIRDILFTSAPRCRGDQ
jgi:hypothetical protein